MKNALKYNEWPAFVKNCVLRLVLKAACQGPSVEQNSNKVKRHQEQINWIHGCDVHTALNKTDSTAFS